MRSCTRCRVAFFPALLSIFQSSDVVWLLADGCLLVANATNNQQPATSLLRSGLSDLLLQTLARIANAFVLVRIGRTQRAHLCRHLAYFLAVNARDAQFRLLGIECHFDPC